jgi:hypothetical protein
MVCSKRLQFAGVPDYKNINWQCHKSMIRTIDLGKSQAAKGIDLLEGSPVISVMGTKIKYL